uniref:Uridine phosphorylase 2 n=1 Tax=Aquila chrysaetos chrysaetos TaxID=223781 RepID=A0A663F1U4_AQUCH
MISASQKQVKHWIEARSVVITDVAVDSSFQLVVLGDVVVRSTELDKDLVGELLACSKEIPDLPTLVGHTMCTYDFYKGQGRLDRALCSFSSGKKREYLKRAYDTGTRNTETESSAFAALCGLCGQCFKARVREVVCTALLDRLEGDQIRAPREEVLREYQQRPQRLIAAFVRKHLGLSSPVGNTLFSTN